VPHIASVTAEPMASRTASLVMGTGDMNYVFHFALYELIECCQELEESLQLLATIAFDGYQRPSAGSCHIVNKLERLRPFDILHLLSANCCIWRRRSLRQLLALQILHSLGAQVSIQYPES
jgi:hypothetical protein